jgi:electron transfer flavoprotein alpha subunit
MRIIGYIPNELWIDEYKGIENILNSKIEALVTDKELAYKASRRYHRVYLVESNIFEPNMMKEMLRKHGFLLDIDIFLSPCTNIGRAVAGIYTGMKTVPSISDVIGLEKRDETLLVKRMVYGGTGVAILRVKPPCVLCVSQGFFRSVEETKGEIVELGSIDSNIEIEFERKKLVGRDPTEADIVIVAGRGIKNKEDLKLIEELAELLDGAWSATRPLAADYGWVDSWIGISGLIVSPKFYIGIGVSGQPHHLMGARNSKYILAINKDPNAPIFEEVDIGIVGDLYKILPKLIDKLKKM